MYKDDLAYVAMRLNATVVRYKKEGCLVYVNRVYRDDDRSLHAEVSKLDKEEEQFDVALEDLNLSSPMLGNTNHQGHSLYIARMPKRNDWRQGLRPENLVYISKGRANNFRVLPLKLLSQAVYATYKSYKKCLERVGDGRTQSQSFSRNFSLDKERQIWYKGREIVGRDKNGIPTLSPKFIWLKEALSDELRT
jgi:hypothetical protein